ncbi:MAG: hypothetical protein QRY74_04140 [Chlamydia sp.]
MSKILQIPSNKTPSSTACRIMALSSFDFQAEEHCLPHKSAFHYEYDHFS